MCDTIPTRAPRLGLPLGRWGAPLQELRVWLVGNNAAVMSVLMLVIGAVLAGKGMSGLSS